MTNLDTIRATRLNRILRGLDAILGASADMEIAAKYCRDPNDAFEDEAYANLLSAIYDLTEIDAVYEREQELRHQLNVDAKEQAECDRADYLQGLRDDERYERREEAA